MSAKKKLSAEKRLAAIQEFGRLLVRVVRDEALQMADEREVPAHSTMAKRWAGLGDETIRSVAPDIVDQTLFTLMDALDNGHIHLVYVTNDGEKVDLCDDDDDGSGELAGLYLEWRQSGAERFHSWT